jgi:FIST C domain/FIST N domain
MRIQKENGMNKGQTTVASGFAAGDRALPELAAVAVKDGLANAGSDYAHSVLLFLSGHFVQHAQTAVSAAARAGRCLQVSGCTVPGVFTEKASALDQPAAAALVMCGDVSLGLPRENEARLCLALPSRFDAAGITDNIERFGTMSTGTAGADGQAGGQLWTHSKLSTEGHCEIAVHGAETSTAVSRGIRVLSPPLEVNDSDNFEVLQLGDDTALDSLLRRLDPATRKLDALPPQRIFAALPYPGADANEAMQSGRYTLLPVLRVNRDERSITLAAALPRHAILCWVERDPVTAEHDMSAALINLAPGAGRRPVFGLMFCCIGRGPYFYQGQDRDLELTRSAFPALPLLGVYGAGEIAPVGPAGNQRSKLLTYSSVITIATVVATDDPV